MTRPAILVTILAAAALCAPKASAGDDVALKTNLIYDATLSPDLAIEFGLAPKWSLDIDAHVNAWTVSGHRWRHWMVMPEARYWLCSRFAGHFFGLHVFGGQFNVGNMKDSWSWVMGQFKDLSTHRYQGWMGGAGLAYGYSWVLGKHWNLEAELGVGWAYTKSDVYPCADCGDIQQKGKVHNYFGLTKTALSIVYIF
ncbi:MAG: DUF3575 domain-containing protein [Bacteroidales bacterium]|nr:DUF3575 domain-containing protein [Bacteroidales bacterium]